MQQEKARLSASMVMYTKPEQAYKSICSVCEKVSSPNFVLYLIDNASPDGAAQKLLQMPLPPNVRVVQLDENRGYGAGHNSILPFINSSYHAVLNPDIAFFEDTLSQIADWLDMNKDVVIAAPGLVFPNEEKQNLPKNRPAVLPLLARQTGLRFLKKYDDDYLRLSSGLNKPMDVEFCSGSFFVMKSNIFKEIGGFDEKYFMYVEDADITKKALQQGRAVFLPQFVACHEWQREARKNPRKFFWQFKSMLRYFKKWGFKWK